MRIDGRLQATTWDACLDDLSARLRAIIERDGPEAIGIFFGSGVGMDAAGYRMAQALHAAIGTPARFSPLTIDGTAKVLVSDLVGGSAGLNPRPDYENASFVMYVGSNPVVSHGHTVAMPDPVSAIRALRTHAEVWVLDPRLTETARLATRHLAPRPGTDHAVLAFLVREVLGDGADPDTLQHRTVGREELAAAVEPFTRFGHQLEGVELPVSPPDGSFGPGPRSRPETHAFLGEWPCAVLADEIRAGNIRAVLNLGGHLITAFPETNVLRPALESLDVFATMEIIGNETTAISTHVLPTKDQLERADVTLWDFLLPRVAAQHTPVVVDPVGDRRSTWWVLAELGRRLGYELADTTGENATDDARLAAVTAHAGCTIDELVAAGWVETDHELPAPWVERHIDRLGGWRLAPRLLVDQLGALKEPAPLVLVPRRQVRHLNSQLDYLGETADVLLNPGDAAGAGVVDGQEVVVRSAHGELVATARIDPSLRAGSVSVPHGHQRANVNRLTGNNDIDLLTGMALYSGVPVSVEPA